MSQAPNELDNALRAITHDVRASLGVLLPGLGELEHEARARGVLEGRIHDLVAMMRRSCRRLEILAEAAELSREQAPMLPPVRTDVVSLIRGAVAARVAMERGAGPDVELLAPPQLRVAVVAPWCRYIVGEAMAFALKRAQARCAVELQEGPEGWQVRVSSDAPARPQPIGAPFTHPLGLALELSRRLGGDVQILPGETVAVRVRFPTAS